VRESSTSSSRASLGASESRAVLVNGWAPWVLG
jgi:hypothetical protein